MLEEPKSITTSKATIYETIKKQGHDFFDWRRSPTVRVTRSWLSRLSAGWENSRIGGSVALRWKIGGLVNTMNREIAAHKLRVEVQRRTIAYLRDAGDLLKEGDFSEFTEYKPERFDALQAVTVPLVTGGATYSISESIKLPDIVQHFFPGVAREHVQTASFVLGFSPAAVRELKGFVKLNKENRINKRGYDAAAAEYKRVEKSVSRENRSLTAKDVDAVIGSMEKARAKTITSLNSLTTERKNLQAFSRGLRSHGDDEIKQVLQQALLARKRSSDSLKVARRVSSFVGKLLREKRKQQIRSPKRK